MPFQNGLHARLFCKALLLQRKFVTKREDYGQT